MQSSSPLSRRHAVRTAGLVALQVGVVFTAYFVLPLRGERTWIGAVAVTVLLAGLVPLALRRSQAIATSATPVTDGVRAIALVGTLYVVGLSSAFYVLAERTDDQIEGIRTKVDAMYFTVTMASTTGFGDIVPTGQVARAMTTGSMVVTLVLLGTSIRLIASATRRGADRRQRGER